MNLRATSVLLTAAGSMFVGAGPKLVVTAPGHTPPIGVHWSYTVTVTEGGKKVAARLSEQIVDPIGGHHPVEFGTSTKNITNWPVKGTFKDFIIWPKDSRGIPLTFRVSVKVGSVTKVENYSVTPTG
jgi:hypothetical protein